MWSGIVGKPFKPAEFEAYVAAIKMAAWHPQFVVVHNTSAPTLAQWHGKVPAAQRIKNLENYYKNEQHWSAGPHLFIADDFIWAFTPLTVPGVHSPSWNKKSWGVEIVGEYDIEDFAPVRENVISALTSLHRKGGFKPADFKLGVSGLHFHKEDPSTTHKRCPGKHVVKADLIAAIAQRLAAK